MEKTAELLRKELGSINLSDLEENLSSEEAREIASEATAFYHGIFKDTLNKLIQDQLEFMGKEAQTEDQFIVGRGTINGLLLIKEWFNEQEGIVKEGLKPDEDIRSPLDNI